MEDSRRPFTPFLQADTPSPDSSPSPERNSNARRVISGKGGESSVSPGRKKDSTNRRDNAAKKDSKDGKSSSQNSKKDSVEAADTAVSKPGAPNATAAKPSTKAAGTYFLVALIFFFGWNFFFLARLFF